MFACAACIVVLVTRVGYIILLRMGNGRFQTGFMLGSSCLSDITLWCVLRILVWFARYAVAAICV